MALLTTGNGLPNVVVTGVAMTTALATDADNTWKNLLDGQSGIRLLDDPFVEQYDLPVRIGGHLLEEFDSQLNKVENRRMSYLQKMATVLGRRVWESAGSPEVDTRRLMVSIGTGMIPLIAPNFKQWMPHDIHPLIESGILLSSLAAVLLNLFFNGARGDDSAAVEAAKQADSH